MPKEDAMSATNDCARVRSKMPPRPLLRYATTATTFPTATPVGSPAAGRDGYGPPPIGNRISQFGPSLLTGSTAAAVVLPCSSHGRLATAVATYANTSRMAANTHVSPASRMRMASTLDTATTEERSLPIGVPPAGALVAQK